MSDENTPIRLPGSETYWNAYDWGGEISKQFPGQDGDEFAYATLVAGCDYTGWDCRSWGYWMTGVVTP